MNHNADKKDLLEIDEVLLDDFGELGVQKIFLTLLIFSYATLFIARKMFFY